VDELVEGVLKPPDVDVEVVRDDASERRRDPELE
jgi:hypothetical protein